MKQPEPRTRQRTLAPTKEPAIPDDEARRESSTPGDRSPSAESSKHGEPARAGTRDSVELERALGLKSALGIGVGTMIGAGIFVFPGLAAGEAGSAASVSFAIGAGIAFLVALSASELATAMPESGGAYYFVSRGLGAAYGSLVGIGQWIGLVFAAAFYLAGAGYYLAEVARSVGVAMPLPPAVIGCAAALVLTGISLLGTHRAGALQDAIVTVLVVILAVFLAAGLLAALGLLPDAPRAREPFAPYGLLPVLTTAALVFTSYLGFAQIAAVAGEIRDPGRTIPLAMIGSVLVVGAMYVLTMLVATSLLASERLADLGETAMVEVGRALLGPVGAVAFLGAGVLATLSSANASILSSSRSVFALGRDGLVPKRIGAVNERFRTPHVALLLAGVPIAALSLLGRVEILAEVASVLHLVLYGLVCFALIAFRRRASASYSPEFRCPGYPAVPALGGLASFGLIFFMQTLSQLVAAGLLLAAALWHRFYASSVRLKEVES